MLNNDKADTLYRNISSLLNECMKDILLFTQASVSESQYSALRKLIMNSFGKGLHERLLGLILSSMERAGAEKQMESRKEP